MVAVWSVPAASGWATLLGLAAILGLVGAGVLLAQTVRGLIRSRRPATPVDGEGPPLELLNYEALCALWHGSSLALQQEQTPAAKLSIVERRAQYLDEFERRRPGTVQTWLETGSSR